jgi:hypothetical protein
LVQFAECVRGKQNKTTGQPGPRVRDGVADTQILSSKVEVPDVADVAIQRGEFVAVQVLGVLQVRIDRRDDGNFLRM